MRTAWSNTSVLVPPKLTTRIKHQQICLDEVRNDETHRRAESVATDRQCETRHPSYVYITIRGIKILWG